MSAVAVERAVLQLVLAPEPEPEVDTSGGWRGEKEAIHGVMQQRIFVASMSRLEKKTYDRERDAMMAEQMAAVEAAKAAEAARQVELRRRPYDHVEYQFDSRLGSLGALSRPQLPEPEPEAGEGEEDEEWTPDGDIHI